MKTNNHPQKPVNVEINHIVECAERKCQNGNIISKGKVKIVVTEIIKLNHAPKNVWFCLSSHRNKPIRRRA